MKAFPDRRRPQRPAWSRRLFAAGSAALVLALSLVAASPDLHRWLHPAAGQPDHECAVTLLQHGGIEVGAAAIVVAPMPVTVARLETAPTGPDLPTPRFRLRPGRAPPGC